jgi:hypothetical protein
VAGLKHADNLIRRHAALDHGLFQGRFTFGQVCFPPFPNKCRTNHDEDDHGAAGDGGSGSPNGFPVVLHNLLPSMATRYSTISQNVIRSSKAKISIAHAKKLPDYAAPSTVTL